MNVFSPYDFEHKREMRKKTWIKAFLFLIVAGHPVFLALMDYLFFMYAASDGATNYPGWEPKFGNPMHAVCFKQANSTYWMIMCIMPSYSLVLSASYPQAIFSIQVTGF